LGVAPPTHPKREWVFDQGHDTPEGFRAYAWGGRGTAWDETSSWLVRVATHFGPKPFWSTAPTRSPWPSWLAPVIFGSDTGARQSADWTLDLDPDESSGVLRVVTSSGFVEFHWIEDGRAIASVTATGFPPPSDVVRTPSGMLLSVSKASSLELYKLTQRDVGLVASFPVVGSTKNQVVRTLDGSRLAVWSRGRDGSWYFYPLDTDFTPSSPIVVPREQLSRTPAVCDAQSDGWLVRYRPLASDVDLDSSELRGHVANRYDVQDLEAKLVVNANGACLQELAATVKRKAASLAVPAPPPTARIPMTARDNSSGDLVLFRCEPR
jgi:hypothetical protein